MSQKINFQLKFTLQTQCNNVRARRFLQGQLCVGRNSVAGKGYFYQLNEIISMFHYYNA